MPAEPHDRNHPPTRNDPSDDDLWENMPMRLERDGEALESHEPPGGESAPRPLPPPPAPPVDRGELPWLGHWLLLTGIAGGAFALGSIVLALFQEGQAVEWRGGLFAFDVAVILLIVRSFLRGGLSSATLCHRMFGVTGLAASGLLLQTAVLRAAVRFIHDESPQALLSQMFVFGLLGLAGVIVFVQCMRERGWACRTAAAAAVILAVLLAAQPLTGYGLFGERPVVPVAFFLHRWWSLSLIGLCAAACTLLLALADVEPAKAGKLKWSAGALLALLVPLVVYVARAISREWADGPPSDWPAGTGPAAAMWVVAGVWETLGLLPLVLSGVVIAWRRRGALGADVMESVSFMWVLATAGGLACLAFWGPVQWQQQDPGAPLLLVGILAAMLGVWLGTTGGDWTARWALLPAGGLVVTVAGTLRELVIFARGRAESAGAAWLVVICALWCCLLVGLTFAAAGLFVLRRKDRAERPRFMLWTDLRLLRTTGTTVCFLLLCIWFARIAGDQNVAQGLSTALSDVMAGVRDMLAMGGKNLLTRLALRTIRFLLQEPTGQTFSLALPGVLLAVLLVHLIAAPRARWSFLLVGSIWVVPLAAGSALVLLLLWRLFFPLNIEPLNCEVATEFGRMMLGSFAAKLFPAAFLAAVLLRLWEACVSALRIYGRRAGRLLKDGAERLARAAEAESPPSPNRHLVFLVRAGVYASVVGLALALLLFVSPSTNAVPFKFSQLGQQWLTAVNESAYSVGRHAVEWPGYAIAVALAAYLLIAVHDEARHGRVAVYPVVAGSWLMLLVPHVAGWFAEASSLRDPRVPGRSMALVFAGLILAVLLAAAVAMLLRWAKLRSAVRGERGSVLDTGTSFGSGRSLGSLGLALWIALCAIGAHGVLMGVRLQAGAVPLLPHLTERTAARLDTFKDYLATTGRLHWVPAALAGFSLLALILHVLSRHRIAWARNALFALWVLAVAGLVAAAGYALSLQKFGEWTAGRLVAAMLLAAILARALIALTNAGSWLTRQPSEE